MVDDHRAHGRESFYLSTKAGFTLVVCIKFSTLGMVSCRGLALWRQFLGTQFVRPSRRQ